MERKKNQGRKKIEMKMIADENSRRTTFSKRRMGLFKKAMELSTLCGVQVAIILFSMEGKAFSFGSPNVESVLNSFIEGNQQNGQVSMASDRENRVRELMRQMDEKREQLLDMKKKRAKTLEKRLEKSPMLDFEVFINKLDKKDLIELKNAILDLKKDVDERMSELQSSAKSEHVETSNSQLEVEHVGISGLRNAEKYDGDGFPIPHDWLKL